MRQTRPGYVHEPAQYKSRWSRRGAGRTPDTPHDHCQYQVIHSYPQTLHRSELWITFVTFVTAHLHVYCVYTGHGVALHPIAADRASVDRLWSSIRRESLHSCAPPCGNAGQRLARVWIVPPTPLFSRQPTQRAVTDSRMCGRAGWRAALFGNPSPAPGPSTAEGPLL